MLMYYVVNRGNLHFVSVGCIAAEFDAARPQLEGIAQTFRFDPTAPTRVVRVERYRLAISLPNDWVVDDSAPRKAGPIEVALVAGTHNQESSVGIRIALLPSYLLTLDRMLQNQIEQTKEHADADLIGSGKTTIHGRPAVWLRATEPAGSGPRQQKWQFYRLFRGRYLLIAFVYPASDFEKDRQAVEGILQTLHFDPAGEVGESADDAEALFLETANKVGEASTALSNRRTEVLEQLDRGQLTNLAAANILREELLPQYKQLASDLSGIPLDNAHRTNESMTC